ncbi:MAG: hypothetical protein EAZ70_12430 [Runella slithyformis]|nr:MAG: hypothetical protein EAY79_00365 [Runella slithyformis]TAE93049.1 MAG: hypothetical protein EAZ80_11835 [Runella slithyformis]TAF23999.1 MAG: hypothetical protein EAZ70_12430 [Runella slithyformis]TAF43141.1 MAG: hypothetical protein EAZ63_14115 [Runella slithyformis]TAF83686.1 MAG: hypothetical protein EAZ50_00175 [Runella slithyformis]
MKVADYQQILNNKDFDFLYNLVFVKINYWGNSDKISNENHGGQLKFYRSEIEKLHFKSIHWDFKLIEQENISCFIPLNIPIEVDGVNVNTKDAIFSKNELAFLKIHGVEPTRDYCINGTEVFDLYIYFIQNRREFIQQKIGEKTLQGIMSKFIFSLFASKKVENQIIHFSDEEKSAYGYKYIHFWKDFYGVEFGMDSKRFEGNETQFL